MRDLSEVTTFLLHTNANRDIGNELRASEAPFVVLVVLSIIILFAFNSTRRLCDRVMFVHSLVCLQEKWKGCELRYFGKVKTGYVSEFGVICMDLQTLDHLRYKCEALALTSFSIISAAEIPFCRCPAKHYSMNSIVFCCISSSICKPTRRKIAVVRRSLKFRPATDPLPVGAGRPKFNQLEMVTTFTYKPSLVRIDACNFELSW